MGEFEIIAIVIIIGVVCYFSLYKNSDSQTEKRAKNTDKEAKNSNLEAEKRPSNTYEEAQKRFKTEYINTKSGALRKGLENVFAFSNNIDKHNPDYKHNYPGKSYDMIVKVSFIISIKLYINNFVRMHRLKGITDEEKERNEQIIYFGSDLIRELYKAGDINLMDSDRLVLGLLEAGNESGCNLDTKRIMDLGVKMDANELARIAGQFK